jgi:molybdopterin molybdotransferase
MLVNISLEEAQSLISNHVRPLSAEAISILASLGRVSAVDVTAPSDLPGHAQSAVDGYALSSLTDIAARKYLLTGNVQLGEVPPKPLQPGQALGVLTGGNLPDGTIAVIPHEKVDIKNNMLYPLEEVNPGNNIKQPGEDFPQGSGLISSGSEIGAADISLLAAFGTTSIEVYRQPRVAVLCLSKNIVPWQLNPEPGQMRDSNGPLLSSLVIQAGGIPVACLATDRNSASFSATVEKLLEQVDVLIITGGTYAEGDNEARLLMKKLGAELLYWDLPIQPGSHTGASLWNSRLIFALSGNPAACAVGYHLLVAPALHAMQGLFPGLPRITAACTNGFPKQSGSRRFIRGHLSWTEAGWQVTVLPGQKPSMIRSLIRCNALIDRPAGSPPIEAGKDVSVIVLEPLFQG